MTIAFYKCFERILYFLYITENDNSYSTITKKNPNSFHLCKSKMHTDKNPLQQQQYSFHSFKRDQLKCNKRLIMDQENNLILISNRMHNTIRMDFFSKEWISFLNRCRNVTCQSKSFSFITFPSTKEMFLNLRAVFMSNVTRKIQKLTFRIH